MWELSAISQKQKPIHHEGTKDTKKREKMSGRKRMTTWGHPYNYD
jgi:hypothetical protein